MRKKSIQTFYEIWPLIMTAVFLLAALLSCIGAEDHHNDEARCASLGGTYSDDKCYVNGVEK